MQQEANKGFFTLPPSFLQFIPWIPFAVESMTGQKIPHLTGTMADIQIAI
ncbi:MAG: hypothetical protein GBAus27B_000407 [Mycoplasmataceae bacterium]|nr:MAG: hypothetical protein GBAus27B_000407 [Mycoplasmataceae bacterium]